MPKLRTNQILKANSEVKSKKLTAKIIESFINETIEKQNFILSLKNIDEKSLKSVVQL